MRIAIRALIATLVLAVLTGLLYPLAITLVAQIAMSGKADGSLVGTGGDVVGSSLIGQAWDGDSWFHGRPSAASYDASASTGSNLGPTSEELATTIRQRITETLAREGPYVPGLTAADVPVDLVTASASGLDPEISVAAAELQAPRIAAVRGISLDDVRRLIEEHTQGRTLGFLGEPRVNVLELDLALEEMR
jgi:K+-transporting ATPase ATPase C chain